MLNNRRTYLAYTPHSLLGPLALLFMAGCEVIHGSGHVVTEKRSLSEFDQLILEGEGEVRFTQADTLRLSIEAEDNLIDELITRVHGDTLTIKTRDRVLLAPTEPILYHVEAPSLSSLRIDGSGELRAGALETQELDVEIRGSGTLRIEDLTARALSTDISGSGDVRLGGEIETQDVQISGSGEYRCKNLKSADAHVSVSGSGEVEVFVSDTLEVEISGSGDVAVRGTPKTHVDISGSGDVRSLN